MALVTIWCSRKRWMLTGGSIACEFAFGVNDTETTYVASQVDGLPSTGAGQGSSPESEDGFVPIVAVILMLITWAAALIRHPSSR